MKLCVFAAVLLLVPLALALPSPVAKFVYSTEDMMDHVITEVNNVTLVLYGYQYGLKKPYNLTFDVVRNTSRWVDFYNMRLKGDPKTWNVSFVVEAYPKDLNEVPDSEFCVKNSDANLRSLIAECYSKIVLRNLTTDEKNQLQKSKAGWINFFEVSYDKQVVKARSKLLNDFKLYFSKGWMPMLGKFNHGFNVSTWDHTYRPRSMGFRAPALAERSFVVAGMPRRTVSDCYETPVSDLKADYCQGDVQLVSAKPYKF